MNVLGWEVVLSWNFVVIIIVLFNKCVWNVYYELGIMLGVGDFG